MTSNDEPSIGQLVEMQRRLGVPLEFDSSGWLSGAIEIRVVCDRLSGTLSPRAVRVSAESPVEELAARGGVVQRCEEYNQALHALCELLVRFDVSAEVYRTSVAVDQEFDACHAALRSHQSMALRRIDAITGNGVITLAVLDGEIENAARSMRLYEAVLKRVDSGYAPSVTPRRGPVHPWDEETLDGVVDD